MTTRPADSTRISGQVRRTKIVATLGPATADPGVVAAMIAAGMDVARINLSHGRVEDHRAAIAMVRAAARDAGREVGVMIDLPGPKLRLGELPEPVELARGQLVTLGDGGTPDVGGAADVGAAPGPGAPPGAAPGPGAPPGLVAKSGEDLRLPVTFPELVTHLVPGQRVLIDDGAVELVVVQGSAAPLLEVITPGVVSAHKGVNLPDTTLPIPALTPRDEELLRFGLDEDVDLVALSFVRRADDVLRLRQLIAAGGGDQLIVAKIEKREALEAIDEIVAASDAVMVARGDLGVEIPPAEVPLWQKRIVALARACGKPVITATQMLQSMVAAPRPTRAEASDVANAIVDSTDAVMLSGETAVGAYPVEAVRTMADIAMTVEDEIVSGTSPDRPLREPAALPSQPAVPPPAAGACPATASGPVADAISSGACDVARKIGAAAIVTATVSGAMGRAVARYRAPQPVVAVTPRRRTARQLMLSWGVTPLVVDLPRDLDAGIVDAAARVIEAGFAASGDTVVITCGMHVFESGGTNLIKAHVLG